MKPKFAVMAFSGTAIVAALVFSPARAADEKCITKDEAMKLGIVIGAQSVREGLEICLRHYPKIKDETFVPGAEKNLEKAQPAIDAAEKSARAGFERAYGENGQRRFDRFQQDAITSTRQSLSVFGEIECRASLVGYAKIAEILAEKPEEAHFIGAQDLGGDLPICDQGDSVDSGPKAGDSFRAP